MEIARILRPETSSEARLGGVLPNIRSDYLYPCRLPPTYFFGLQRLADVESSFDWLLRSSLHLLPETFIVQKQSHG
jgi:hypothetical protein